MSTTRQEIEEIEMSVYENKMRKAWMEQMKQHPAHLKSYPATFKGG